MGACGGFTYIDNAAEAVIRLLDRVPRPDPNWSGDEPNPATSAAPWRLFNIGNSNPVDVSHVVGLIERAVGKKAVVRHEGMQQGDVSATCAEVSDLEATIGFRPKTPIEDGIERFVAWYRAFHQI